MRKVWIIGVTAASLFGTGFLVPRKAMTIPAPVGLQATRRMAAYRKCITLRRVWRCGY